MKNFEYNWATAEMVKMYLQNSYTQEAWKTCATTKVSTDVQEMPVTDIGFRPTGLVTTNDGTGTDHLNLDSDSDSSDEDTP